MYQRSAMALRRMRQRIFDFPPEQEERADRVLAYLKERVLRQSRLRGPVGTYSGLTRQELRKSGTCEPDWF